MTKTLDILIDGSGSMGYLKGSLEENKYLLPDGNTRTTLVKKILIENLNDTISLFENITIKSFKTHESLDSELKPILINGKRDVKPYFQTHYNGKYSKNLFIHKIQEIKDPEPGATALCWALGSKLLVSGKRKSHILVITDGDNNVHINTPENWQQHILEYIKKYQFVGKIHIIGISQNDVARKRCSIVCNQTGGVYVNLSKLDFDTTKLESLLINLKVDVVTDVIKENIFKTVIQNESSTLRNENSEPPSKEEDNNTTEDSTTQISLESLKIQVDSHTNTLQGISVQLQNIIALLKDKDKLLNADEEVAIHENSEYNSRIGRKAEEFLYTVLSNKKWESVEWMNRDGESYKSFDFIVKDKGSTVYYECKGTSGDLSEFHLSKNEWEFYLQNKNSYRICFVSDVEGNPKVYRLKDLLKDIEERRVRLHSDKNRKVKAGNVMFFLNKELCETLK
ncbi:protein NO VEIN domain-containing protein [Aequorivita ciconiae]|nr:DUF3883 domain-containing protein [Aequorivita sp. H23M31]